MEIRRISAQEARPLRAAVLRPNRPLADSIYPTDDDAETLHMGGYVDGELVTVATVFPDPLPESGMSDGRAWRLRGMGTRPDMQHRGYGRAVLEKCIEHVRAEGGTLFWCNARSDAVEFYRTLGFETLGEEQRTPHGTPFIRMLRPLDFPSAQNQEHTE